MPVPPGAKELYRQLLDYPRDERWALLQEADRQYGIAWDGELRRILSATQYTRFREILCHAYGPRSILDYDDLPTTIGLTPEQLTAMQRIAGDYQQQRQPFRHALMGYMLTGRTGLEEWHGSEDRKVRKVISKMKSISMKEERDLLQTMTPGQLDTWRRLMGKPIHLGWSEGSTFSYTFDWSERAEVPQNRVIPLI